MNKEITNPDMMDFIIKEAMMDYIILNIKCITASELESVMDDYQISPRELIQHQIKGIE